MIWVVNPQRPTWRIKGHTIVAFGVPEVEGERYSGRASTGEVVTMPKGRVRAWSQVLADNLASGWWIHERPTVVMGEIDL